LFEGKIFGRTGLYMLNINNLSVTTKRPELVKGHKAVASVVTLAWNMTGALLF
jgi:hypothetical protein